MSQQHARRRRRTDPTIRPMNFRPRKIAGGGLAAKAGLREPQLELAGFSARSWAARAWPGRRGLSPAPWSSAAAFLTGERFFARGGGACGFLQLVEPLLGARLARRRTSSSSHQAPTANRPKMANGTQLGQAKSIAARASWHYTLMLTIFLITSAPNNLHDDAAGQHLACPSDR